MLSVFALGAIIGQAGDFPPLMHRDRLLRFLKDAGYAYSSSHWQPLVGALTHEGRSFRAQMAFEDLNPRNHVPWIVLKTIRLSVSIDLGAYDPAVATASRLPRRLPSPAPAFVPLPGHRATAFVDLDWREVKTAEALRKGFDRFWREVEAFGGKPLAPEKTDWSGARFPDDTILAEADLVHLERLFKAWRWWVEPPEGPEGLNGAVDGERISAWVNRGEGIFRLGGEFSLPESKPYPAWSARHAGEAKATSAPYGDGRLIFLPGKLDPSRDMRLDEVRRQVRALAHRTTWIRKLP